MPRKRERDEDVSLESGADAATNDTRKPKKAKHGFRVGPENLPDGAWRRKGMYFQILFRNHVVVTHQLFLQ